MTRGGGGDDGVNSLPNPVKKTEVVACLIVAFGNNQSNEPNNELYGKAGGLRNQLVRDGKRVLVIRQKDAKRVVSFYDPGGGTIPSHETTRYLDTRDVLQIAKNTLSFEEARFGIKIINLTVFCHEDHKKRVVGTAQKMGLPITDVITTTLYDWREPQVWCKFRWIFLLREGLARWLYRRKGWMY